MTEDKKINIDYRDPESLKQFVSENGKILSSRYTRLNAKDQRKLTKAVKKARILGFLPFTAVSYTHLTLPTNREV